MNTDIIYGQRFTKNWRIGEIMHLPEQSSFAENYLIQEGITAFYGGKIRSVAQKISLEGQQIHYNSFDGVLTFTASQRPLTDADGIPEMATDHVITLNNVARNESSIAYRKQIKEAHIDHQQVIPLIEMFAQLRIPFDQFLHRNVATPGQPKENIIEYINENIIDMSSAISVGHSEIARLLGLNRSYKDSKGQFSSPLYEVQSLSVFEKQVYLQGS